MSERTRYLFNRNASAHAAAILKFAIFASVPAGVMSLAVPAMTMPAERTAEMYKLAGAMGLSILVIVWCCIFGSMTWVYWALIEMQYHAPTPPEKRKNIAYYVNGHEWKPDAPDRVGG